MNRNIEVIDKNIIAVNFEHINMGFIKDIRFIEGDCSDYASLTKDGKILLNKNNEVYEKNLRVLRVVMKLSDARLQDNKSMYSVIRKVHESLKKLSSNEIDKVIEQHKLNDIVTHYFRIFNLEKQRRKNEELHKASKKRRKWGVKYGKH